MKKRTPLEEEFGEMITMLYRHDGWAEEKERTYHKLKRAWLAYSGDRSCSRCDSLTATVERLTSKCDALVKEADERALQHQQAALAPVAKQCAEDMRHVADGLRLKEANERMRTALEAIKFVSAIHYAGGAFDPEHMRQIANFAVTGIAGTPDNGEVYPQTAIEITNERLRGLLRDIEPVIKSVTRWTANGPEDASGRRDAYLALLRRIRAELGE